MRPDLPWQRLRKLVLAGVVAVIVGGAILDYATGTFAAFGLPMLRFFCPVGFVEISLATRSIVWTALPYTLLSIGVVFLFGRFPCGWLCPFYKFKHWLESLAPLGRVRRATPGLPIRASWRDGVAVLVGVLAVSAITGYPIYCIVCPIGIISRNLISLGTHLTVHSDVILLAFYPIVLGLFVDWQRVCPVGNLGAVANRVAPLKPIQVDEAACVQCTQCLDTCPEDISVFDAGADMESCTACMRCYDVCDGEAIRLYRARDDPPNG